MSDFELLSLLFFGCKAVVKVPLKCKQKTKISLNPQTEVNFIDTAAGPVFAVSSGFAYFTLAAAFGFAVPGENSIKISHFFVILVNTARVLGSLLCHFFWLFACFAVLVMAI